jgi:DedD protein
MEKKKILLVAVSVGVFLVIVMGAAILLFSPKAGQTAIPPGAPGIVPPKPASVDVADMTRNTPETVQGLQLPPPSATASQENVFYFMGDNPDQVVSKTTENNETRVLISVPKPATAAVPDAPPPAETRRSNPAPARPAPRTPPASAAKTPAPPAVKPAASAPQPRNDYWVQTGSFSSRDRADGVKESLASKGIASIIENRELEGKTFYRVRIGPYASQSEANYWLALIKTMQGFENSMVLRSR